MWTLMRIALPPTLLTITPSQLGVMSLTMRLPPIVLVLIDQGIAPPPPISMTFPLTVIPFSRTVSASQAMTFPLTVMLELRLRVAVCVHARMSRRVSRWIRQAAQAEERARTGRDVVSDGDRRRVACASSTAPAATSTLPTTLITASGAGWHAPVTVMLP